MPEWVQGDPSLFVGGCIPEEPSRKAVHSLMEWDCYKHGHYDDKEVAEIDIAKHPSSIASFC